MGLHVGPIGPWDWGGLSGSGFYRAVCTYSGPIERK